MLTESSPFAGVRDVSLKTTLSTHRHTEQNNYTVLQNMLVLALSTNQSRKRLDVEVKFHESSVL